MAIKAKEKMITVKLPRISGEFDRVFVSVGPRQWIIKRGVTVDIPECAYDVLRNAEIAEDAAVSYKEDAPGGASSGN